MAVALLVAVGGFGLVNLVASAALLWLACRLLRRRPLAGEPASPTVSFRRALALTAVGAGIAAVLLAATTLIGQTLSPTPPAAALVGQAAALLLLPLLVVRVGLPGGWPRAVAVWLTWLLLGAAQVAVAVLAARSLFVETMLVPTGAMAETLLGPHKRVGCPLCRLTFPVDATAEATAFLGTTVRINGCICPNCRHALALVRGGDPPAAGPSLPDPGVRRGDRLLVARGLIAAGWRPERFDPVVFRYPGPIETAVGRSMRYLQRVVGLPGEMIAIHRGKLWALDPAEVPVLSSPAGGGEPRVGPDAEAERLFRAGKFRLLRKPPALTLALRRLVHDADHPVAGPLARGVRGWQPAGGWTSDGGGRFRLDHGDQPLPSAAELVYHHILPGKASRELVTDFAGYNAGRWGMTGGPERPVGGNWAADLTLECEVDIGQSAGTVALGLARGPDRFLATFDLAAGTCRLTRRAADDTLEELGLGKALLVAGVPVRLRLAVVDERLTVWLDNGLLFGDGVEFRPSGPLVPQLRTDLQPALIAATCPRLTVRHVRLHTDVYYTAAPNGDPAEADEPGFRSDDPATWPRLLSAPVAAYRVEPGQYFVLGDNSAACSDSRLWGLLPGQNLVGKPVFRYSPLTRLGWLP
ncbi:MAG: S26 family signal peptidase [Gemmataceae bacterium]